MFLRSLFGRLSTRVTMAAAAVWLFYVAGTRPCATWYASHLFAPSAKWYEVPFFFFVAFGEGVAEALGLNARDCGAVQVLSGLIALILCVQLAFWVKGAMRG